MSVAFYGAGSIVNLHSLVLVGFNFKNFTHFQYIGIVMKKLAFSLLMFACSQIVVAETLPFNLNIHGAGINIQKNLQLSDVGEGRTSINFIFSSDAGKQYQFDLNYKKLPSNRSYPANLDVTIKDMANNKLGYLFFANNNVRFFKKMGVFGLIVNIEGDPVDIRFTFDANKQANFRVAALDNERFIQDTLVPKFNFQMIRPVMLAQINNDVRSATYQLDDHPYTVNYSLVNTAQGLVEFQHNLYQLEGGQEQLLTRVYFQADSLTTLREAMYAGKYFHQQDGVFKLVFYPALGQTEPATVSSLQSDMTAL
ncbi:MAG: hypothetical protein methR_P3231 [Methyloprofundus sp.]|nr:MAG: hypothetical protein methR_P3231 [Methyloprofundus sp.]